MVGLCLWVVLKYTLFAYYICIHLVIYQLQEGPRVDQEASTYQVAVLIMLESKCNLINQTKGILHSSSRDQD